MRKIYQRNIFSKKNHFAGKINGFTLIELLVVVLIIGILAAIALPQYEKAVLKSRFVQTQIMSRNIYDALERYHMANGTYPADLTELDIQIPGTYNEDKTAVFFDDYRCIYYYRTGLMDSIFCEMLRPEEIGMRYAFLQKKKYCITTDNKQGKELCTSMGGKNPFDSGAGLWHYELP